MGVWSLLLNGKFFWVAWSWMNLHPVPRSIVCSVWVAQHALLRSLPSLSILINRWLERVRSLLANGVWHLHATRIYRVRILIVTPAEQTSRHFKAEMRRASVKREDWQLQSRMEHHSSNRWQFPPSAVQWQANLFGASDGFDTRWTDWVAASSLKPLKKIKVSWQTEAVNGRGGWRWGLVDPVGWRSMRADNQGPKGLWAARRRPSAGRRGCRRACVYLLNDGLNAILWSRMQWSERFSANEKLIRPPPNKITRIKELFKVRFFNAKISLWLLT